MEDGRTSGKHGSAPGDGPVLRPGARLDLRVVDLTTEGAGVARSGPLVVFVPGAVPGDRVVARLSRLRRGWAEAELVRIEEPSPARRAPPCPHQGTCGGCPLMVLETSAALATKARHLVETLRRIGGIDHPVDGVVASPRELEYRGRVRFAVAPRAEGVAFGFRPRSRGGDVVPIDACLLAPVRASSLAREFLLDLDLRSVQPGAPWPEQIDVRGSLARNEWILVVYGPPGPWPALGASARHFLDGLAGGPPDVAGVVRIGPGPAGRPRETLLAGRGQVVETIGGIDVELGATTFLQVNPAAAGLLYAEIARSISARGTPARLLDLYCGAGLAGLLAAGEETEVVGVERHEATADRARRAAAHAGRARVRYEAADAPAFARAAAANGETFDAIVLNPPREGAGPEIAQAVRDLRPSTVIVVSCHPAALARDLAAFHRAGFVLDRLVAVDMFPQTPHLEAVASLSAPAAP